MIIDTCFVIDVMRGDEGAIRMLDRLEAGSEPILVPSPVLYELAEGAERSTSPPREMDAIERVLQTYPVLEVDADAARRAGRASGQLIRRGQVIDDIDLLIAGIALSRRVPVVTRDTDHFGRVENLRVVGY